MAHSALAGLVDAYCSTGTSPGTRGRTSRRIELDHHGLSEVEVLWEARGLVEAPGVALDPSGHGLIGRSLGALEEVLR